MNICLVGKSEDPWTSLTEYPFIVSGIKRLNKPLQEIKDLECDIAISLYPRICNYRLPKVKVQLALQAEQLSEWSYCDIPVLNYHDGSICLTDSAPFWDLLKKPTFNYNPITVWNGFYKGPCKKFYDFGVVLGTKTTYRNNILDNSNNRIKYYFGNIVTDPAAMKEIKEIGIGYNIHRFKYDIRTEGSRLAMYLNLGMAVISEGLDDFLPENIKKVIPQYPDIIQGIVNKEQALKLAKEQSEALVSGRTLQQELNILFENIKKTFNL